VTVVGRVNQATLPAAVIQTIRKNPTFSRAARISGDTISPAAGYSFWSLSNGGTVIVESTGSTPEAHASQVATKLSYSAALRSFVVEIHVCSCQGSTPNDNCQFATTGGNLNLDQCGGQSCCKQTCVAVDQWGNTADCR